MKRAYFVCFFAVLMIVLAAAQSNLVNHPNHAQKLPAEASHLSGQKLPVSFAKAVGYSSGGAYPGSMASSRAFGPVWAVAQAMVLLS